MKTYCLKCKKDTENSKIFRTKNNRLITQSKCNDCEKKSRFIKEQEAEDLLSNLGIRTSLNKILILGDILF